MDNLDPKTDEAFFNCIDTTNNAINTSVVPETNPYNPADRLTSENLFNAISDNKLRIIIK